MNPDKVVRDRTKRLTDLPNIGKALAQELNMLGITEPDDLVGRDPYKMYEELCGIRGRRQDPCVIDVFISITRFIAGDEPRSWWDYTEERKRVLAEKQYPHAWPVVNLKQ